MNNKKNLLSALIYQMTSIISGLILPRLIIGTFGSDVNGLISSITQFLSFISLLEGGLGAVVLAELYKPIEERDDAQIIRILSACQSFFVKLSIAFCCYTAVLAIVYPMLVETKMNFLDISVMVLILSFSTLSQYLFSITNKLLLQAQQKIYIVNMVLSGTILINLGLALAVIFIFPNIHILKLCSSIAFLIQPIIFNHYIEKKYRIGIKTTTGSSTDVLKNRWNGFAQNLAHFINMNAPVAILTFFTSLELVSVYTVYMLVVNAIRQIISNAANSYSSALGKYYAEGNREQIRERFSKFEVLVAGASVVLYGTCLQLINPFIQLYTRGVQDANYYQPWFALVIVIANLLYCAREPYRLLILAAGKFKETNSYAIIEAVLNVIISVFLVFHFGLIGIAIGTFIAIAYRFVCFQWFLKKNIINSSLRNIVPVFISGILTVLINVFFYCSFPMYVSSYFGLFVIGAISVAIQTALYLGMYSLCKLLIKKS